MIGLVAGQTTLITAILYYFGWVRAQATYSFFGVDVTVLRLSTADFLLRSLNSAFRPLLLLGLTALVGLFAHLVTTRAVTDGRSEVIVPLLFAAATTGVLLVIAGMLGFAQRVVYSTRYPVVAMLLGAGLALLAYAIYWHATLAPARYPLRVLQVAAGIGISISLLLMFWITSVYAKVVGDSLAVGYSNRLKTLPEVVLYSREDLAFDARVVTETVGGTVDGYHYKYSGFRLLTQSGPRYLLLPEEWVRGRDPAYVLEERPGLRMEFVITVPEPVPRTSV